MSDQSIDVTDGVIDLERAAGVEAPKVLPAAASLRDDQPDPRPTAAVGPPAAPRAAGTGGGRRIPLAGGVGGAATSPRTSERRS